jgi:hypothetical protein
MSCIAIDGLDKYGPTGVQGAALAALLVQGEWTSVSTDYTISIVNGLSATGHALQIGGDNFATSLNKTLPAFKSRLIGGFRFAALLAGIGGITLSDGGVAQCSVTIDTTGTISLRGGATTSNTIIATSSVSVSSMSIHYLEYDITIGGSGSYQVWLDGLSIISGIGNTEGGTSNARVNGISFSIQGSTSTWLTIDDLYLFDNTGATNNTALLTNPRIETQFPTGDVQTQFTNNATILGNNYSAVTSTDAPGANTLFLRQFQPEVNVTLNSISCLPEASASGRFKGVVYTDSGGAPHTLLSSGIESFGTITGNTITSALVTPQSLTANTPYWIGFITDTATALAEQDASITGVKAANTYASNAPATAPSMTVGQPSWVIWGNCTGASTNWSSLNNNPAVGNLSYVSSATVGQNDLYSFPALSSTPTAIYTVAIKGNVARTDSGLRTVNMTLKSGSTISNGSNSAITPPTSYSWVDSFFDTDPNTGLAWTSTTLNAATAGPKINS